MALFLKHLAKLAAIALFISTMAAAAEVPDLELPTLDAKRFFRLSEESRRPVVINFWDTECPPCIREMPVLNAVAKSNPDVLFIGISLSPRQQARDFLASHPVSYLQLAGPADPRGVLRRFSNNSGALPYTVVLKSSHVICTSKTGEVDRAWLEAAIDKCKSAPSK